MEPFNFRNHAIKPLNGSVVFWTYFETFEKSLPQAKCLILWTPLFSSWNKPDVLLPWYNMTDTSILQFDFNTEHCSHIPAQRFVWEFNLLFRRYFILHVGRKPRWINYFCRIQFDGMVPRYTEIAKNRIEWTTVICNYKLKFNPPNYCFWG